MRSVLTALILTAVACGGSEHPEATEAPACDGVAKHMVQLAAIDNGAAPEPGLAEGMASEFNRQCREKPWSGARRSCLASAKSQDDTLNCPTQ